MKRSSRSKNFIVLKQKNDVDKIINFFMNSYWSKTGIFVQLMRKDSIKWKNWSDFNERIEEISGFYNRQLQEEDWSKIKTQSWNSLARYRNCKMKLYGWYKRFSRCWISTHWTFPRYQSTCVFLTSSDSRWNAKPFDRNAEPQRWASKHLRHTWYIGKRFFQIQPRLLLHLIRRNWIHGVLTCRNPFTHQRRRRMRNKHQFKIRDASPHRQQQIQSSLVREIPQNFGADQQKLQNSDLHFDVFSTPATFAFLEDKIQDWGMYLFTISCGRHAVDQRSGDGWFSGWFENLRHL